MNSRAGRRLLALTTLTLMLVLSMVASASPADASLRSGKYAVTVLDGGTVFEFTWTIRVTGGAIAGVSLAHGYGFVDPLSGSVQGTGARIVRSCGPGAQARFKDCGSQIYVLQEGAGGVLRGTGTGFGVIPRTTITMRPLSPPKEASIAVSVEAAAPDAGVGGVVGVTVNVAAGAKKLTSVSLGKGLVVAGDAVKITSSPPGLSGFSLAAGGSRSFSFKVKGVKAGASKLSASASGHAGSATVSGSGSDTLKIGKAALAISIVSVAETTALSKFPLDVSEKGQVAPRNVTVKVKVTNTSKLKLSGVSLESLRPVPVDKTQPLDQLGFPRGTFPLRLGTFAPGSTATKTFTLAVTGDGRYELHALVLYDEPGALKGNGVAVATDGEFEATVPTLYYTATLADDNLSDRNGAKWVRAGDWFFVSGRVKNLSSYQSLCLRPLSAKRIGNAGGTGPVDIAVYGAHENAPPLAGGLAPGQDRLWGLWVETSPVGGVRATIKLDPSAAPVEAGDSCEVDRVLGLKPLTPAQVMVTKDSTDFVVHVDVSVPTFAELGVTGAAWNFFMGSPLGLIQGLAVWIQHTVDTAREMVRDGTSPSGLVNLIVSQNPAVQSTKLSAQIYGSSTKLVALLANYWQTATPEEKTSLTRQVQSVLARSADDAYSGAVDATGTALEGWFDNLQAVYANPNDPTSWQALGRTYTSGATQVVIDVALAEVATRIVKAAPALARAFEELGDTSVTFKALKEMPAGKLVNLTELRELWGFAESDIRAFRAIAEEEGVLIGIRGRSPLSVANLEDGAVWKHENLKPKNVSKIDVEWLGFNAEDQGLVAFKDYSAVEREAIQNRVARAGLTAEERAEIADRIDTRFHEAEKYLPSISAADKKGVIDIGFNYSENGINKPTSPKPRGFKLLSQAEGDTGSTYYRPLQENTLLKPGQGLPKWCERVRLRLLAAAKILCRVTGDMDGVYLADLDGTSLSEAKVLSVYKRLEEAGWQHPETFTWVKQMTGEFWFNAKNKILKGLELGGEPMVEFSPRAIRSVFIDLAKSQRFLGTDAWYVDVVGGYSTEVGRVAGVR